MYITADLFDEPASPIHYEHPTTPSWPGLPPAHLSNGLGKRKRQQHLETSPNSHDSLSPLGCPFSHHILSYSRPCTFDALLHTPATPPSLTYTTSPKYNTSERRHIKQIKRHCSRTAVTKSSSHLMDMQPDFEPKPTASSDLRPCHACRSAPKRRKDLENFLDCRRCDSRTCFICARQCCGQCERAVCKKCIVEVGEEGDPWCLDCYSRNINA